MQNRLDGKIAVVTGASSGIGRSIVEHFVAAGASVVAFARNAGALKELAAAHPGKVLAVAGDVTKAEDLQRLVAETVKEIKQLGPTAAGRSEAQPACPPAK